ncbi:hypothetical protein FB446DRAFT_756949, partial [Lentinula raphanica]
HRSDLDTYCLLRNADDVGNWLLSNKYEYRPRRNQLAPFTDDFNKILETNGTSVAANLESEQYPSRTFAAVWNFVREERTVQVIAVKVSVIEAILAFHSTCVMNVITHRAAYCLFAKATLVDHISFDFNGRLNDLHYAPIFQKWTNRGFTISHCPDLKDLVSSSSGFTVGHQRWVGDKACLKVELDDHVKFPQLDTIEANSWHILYQLSHASMKSFLFQPQPSHQGIVIAAQERNHLRHYYDLLMNAEFGETPSVDEAILRSQFSQPRRILTEGGSAAAVDVLQRIMKATEYRLPSYATTRLITANLLQDFHSLFLDVYRHHNRVRLVRARLIKRGKEEIAISIILKIYPGSHPVNVCVYNDTVEKLSTRGLDVRFTWHVNKR